jgi:hypothetical protein
VSDENVERYTVSSSAVQLRGHKLRHVSCKCHTVHQVLQKHLCLYAYKLPVVQAETPYDMVTHKKFVVTMLEKLDEHELFLCWF